MKRIPLPIWLLIAIASMTVLHVTVPIRELAPTPFLVVIAFTMMIDRVFIAGEELMLRKTFSADYEKY